jgi:hypothetical protein
MIFRKIIILLFFLVASLFAQENPNLLQNGSFEQGIGGKGIPKFWGDTSYDQKLIKGGYSDQTALLISSRNYSYSIGAQIVPLNLKEGDRLTVIGYIKGQAIEPQSEKWQGAKAQIIFLDAKNKEISEPLDLLLARTGTFEWDMFIQNVDVPAGAKKAKVLIGLWGAKGSVWFDDLQVYPVYAEQKVKSDNLLDNGDFEIWGKWELLGEGSIDIRNPGYKNSSQALYVENKKPTWTFAMQKISLNNVDAPLLVLTGVAKCIDIEAGKKRWEKGRIYGEFYDSKGRHLGDWVDILTLEKTTNWIPFIKNIKVPAGAQTLKLYFGIQNATGQIVFDDLVLKKE